ncbi:cobalamin biosynthesis protein CobD [Paracoccus caeni]|uniref:Cobalamin biosynthesis protein CobD n=1 Tax=Paracoccus caeni TaxID=657651 RepID=A0A934S9J8_9RHOB|nr:adenosylcobinamide-phosphate synthase CbiB [Paracoccus caeni]MBK4214880.1 cobalamin biosynthesis protein CobD [Paracoccus caeni]
MMALTALIALLVDAAIGWPDRLYQRIGHPVTWLGHLITLLETRLNNGPNRFAKGVATSLIVIAAALIPALALQALLGPVLAGMLAWPLIAFRSLHDHVRAVAQPLLVGDLAAARRATAMIVGRDVRQADEAALSRASIESLAENSSDGVIAPLFWAAIAGLPGIAAYKAINTLDSMIGHRNARYESFGKFAARLDDVANWLPARLTGLLIACVSGRAQEAFQVMRADAGKHRSPNAGWPEAAMAGALHIRLSGPRLYGDKIAEEPWVNGSAPDPGPKDIERGLHIYRRTIILSAVLLLILSVAI